MSTSNEQQNSSQTEASNQTQSSQTPSEPSQQSAADSSTSSTPTDSGSTDLGSDSQTSGTSEQQTPGDSATDLGAEDEATTEAKAPEAPAFFGAPPEGKYADFTLPDGATADPVLAESFTGLAAELGLNQEGAQKLVDYKAKLDQHNIAQWGNHLKDLKTQATADPVIGGARYQPALTAGKAAIAKFMPGAAPAEGQPSEAQAFRKMLNDYGVGAHPLMIRFMSRVGATMGETPSLGNGDSGGVVSKPLHELMYKDSN